MFPFATQRTYTPEQAQPREMRTLHKALHVDRVVIVTPSVYGTDNAATLHGMRTLGISRARAVAVISSEATVRELTELDRAGFRGVRLNFGVGSTPDVEAMRARLTRAIEQVKPLNWHIQIYTNLAAISRLEPALLAAAPMPIVLDHVCGAVPRLGPGQPGFDALLRLVRAGHVYVKITHRFISTASRAEANGDRPCDPTVAQEHSPPIPLFACSSEDAAPIARALIAANPDRMLWGTDWPHPDSTARPGRKPADIAPLEAIDDGASFNLFGSWAGNALRRILVENPARLYRF